MEKGNLLPAKEAWFAVTMSVSFIWSTTKGTLLTLKKENMIWYVCCVIQQWSHCHVKHGKLSFYDDDFVIVKHHGNHSCELKPRKLDINFDEVLTDRIQKGPTQLQKEHLYDILKKKKFVELLKEATNDIVNKSRIWNHKTKLEKQNNLHGCMFQGVASLKQETDHLIHLSLSYLRRRISYLWH